MLGLRITQRSAVPHYIPTIGLEVHCQLNTQSKMFCGCPVAVGAQPNTAVCDVCLGHPGALPVVNSAAIRLAVRAGLAVGCSVHNNSVFARKHYFYPDSPKGYQISQYDRPICTDGAIHISTAAGVKRCEIERIHMEEDAGKLMHDGNRSLVDWNRCGTPLIEIVGRPDLHSAEEAEAFLRMLHRVMVEAGVTKGDMEKGHFRADANVSVSPTPDSLGTRVELKNINSFRFVARAIRHEIQRQIGVIESGGKVVQSTRSWTGQQSQLLRTKEQAADYRYFPDPDLGPVCVEPGDHQDASDALKGQPLDVWLMQNDAERRIRFQEAYELSDDDVGALLGDGVQQSLFEATVAAGGEPSETVKWVRGPIARWLNENGSESLRLTPEALASVIQMVSLGTITREVGRDLVEELCGRIGDPAMLVEERGLGIVKDDHALCAAIKRLLNDHPDEVVRYRNGQTQLLGFFIGGILRQFSGRMDPTVVRQALLEALEDVVSISDREEMS